MFALIAWKRIFIAFVGVGCCLLAYLLGGLASAGLRRQVQSDPLPTINGLYINPGQLDLGEVWATPSHTFPLLIQNLGSSPRTITRFLTTCGCLQLEPEGRTLAPGEKFEFSAHLLLMPGQPLERNVARWPTSVRVDPVFQENLFSKGGWQVKGMVRNRIGIDRVQMVFPDQCTYKGPAIWQKAHVQSFVPLKSLRATVDSKWAAVRVEKNPAAGQYAIHVSPNPSLSIGAFRFTIEVSVETNDGAVYPGPTIEVVGEMQPSTVVMPRVVFLGDHKMPAEAEADVTLKLPGKDWKIDHIETDSAELLVSQAKVSGSEGIRLHLKQRIT